MIRGASLLLMLDQIARTWPARKRRKTTIGLRRCDFAHVRGLRLHRHGENMFGGGSMPLDIVQ
jgi:hypothetical protein